MVHGDIEEVDMQQFADFIDKMAGAGFLTPDEQLEAEIRRIGGLPEKLETGVPEEVQPGEEGEDPEEESPESKSIYKITSLMEKYQAGKITREAATQLLHDIGIEEEKAAFYLKESDTSRTLQEKRAQEKERAKQAARKPTVGRQARQKTKEVEDPVDDEEDARKAQEAKKSLGRSETK